MSVGEHPCHLVFLYFLHMFLLSVSITPPLEERHPPVFGVVGPWLPPQQPNAPEIQNQGWRAWWLLCSKTGALTPIASYKSRPRAWAVSQGKAAPGVQRGTTSSRVRPALPWGAGTRTCAAQLSPLPGGAGCQFHPLVQWKREKPDPHKVDRKTPYCIWLTPRGPEHRFLT